MRSRAASPLRPWLPARIPRHFVPAQNGFGDVIHRRNSAAPNDSSRLASAGVTPARWRRQIASANEVVVAGAAEVRRDVAGRRAPSRSASWMRAAFASSSRCCSISTADSSSAVGLAMSWPAMSGARAVHGLEDADAAFAEVRRRHHAEPADQPGAQVRDDVAVQVGQQQHVEAFGVHHQVHAGGVDDAVVELHLRVARADTVRAHSRKRPSLSFMMLALWTAVTVLAARAAARTGTRTRAIRVDAFSVMIFRLSTTPGTTTCSRPAYRSSVFSRTMTRSTPVKRDGTEGRFQTGRRLA